MPKPKLGYLLFDLPADHEVAGALATECKIVEAVIHNLGLKATVKRQCMASMDHFLRCPTYRYGIQFVHLACHGGVAGIGLLGGQVPWARVADRVVKYLRPLSSGEQRVMVFSCCHSEKGYNVTKSQFSDYITGAYHFCQEKVEFAKAITT